MLLDGFIAGNRVQPPLTGSLMKNLPRSPILDNKIVRVNFKKNIVVTSESMTRKKILASIWDVQDIFQPKITVGSMNEGLTDVRNRHT